MARETPLPALRQIKRDITSSMEWERVIQDLCLFLDHLSGKELLGNFESLSKDGKRRLMRRAARQLQQTIAFRDLQTKLSTTLAHSLAAIPPLVFLSTDDDSHLLRSSLSDAKCTQSDTLVSVNAATVCAYLLQEHCHLKHYLKKCFNYPIPTELRATAWKVLLQNESLGARKEYLMFNNLKEKSEEISSKCEAVLGSSRFLSFLARSSIIVNALKNVMVFWSHCKACLPSDGDILLCVPFIYVWRKSLVGDSKMETTHQMKETLSEVAEVYFSFMDELSHLANQRVVDRFTQEVEGLLEGESPTLYRHLIKIFDNRGHGKRSLSHKRIIHHCLQEMFVGAVPMEVLCFIWDQCFIGCSLYDTLKYFVTSWLIVLKHQFLACKNEADVDKLLSNKHYEIAISQFQCQIDKRFLSQISFQLEIVPFWTNAIKHQKQSPLMQPLWSPLVSTGHTSARQPEPVMRKSPLSQKVFTEKNVRETLSDKSSHHESFVLQGDLLDKEKENYKKEVESLTLQIELLKRKLELSRANSGSEYGSLNVPLVIEAASPKIPSIPSTMNSTAQYSLQCSAADLREHPSTKPLVSSPDAVVSEETLPISSSIPNTKKPYSPNHLTKDDVTDIWFKIFRRFTSAVSLVCHGTGENRQKLAASLQQQKDKLRS